MFNAFDFAVTQAVNTLLFIVQSGGANSKYRKAILKIFRAILIATSMDPEFQASLKELSK